ncbi:putative uncharacterized protein SPANXA2-OT1 [Plecturocebus cupreus]
MAVTCHHARIILKLFVEMGSTHGKYTRESQCGGQSTKYLASIPPRTVKVMKTKERHIRRDWGDATTKCNVKPWIGSWNRKRTHMENRFSDPGDELKSCPLPAVAIVKPFCIICALTDAPPVEFPAVFPGNPYAQYYGRTLKLTEAKKLIQYHTCRKIQSLKRALVFNKVYEVLCLSSCLFFLGTQLDSTFQPFLQLARSMKLKYVPENVGRNDAYFFCFRHLTLSPGWSAVARSQLTATSASWLQAILLPQPPISWH